MKYKDMDGFGDFDFNPPETMENVRKYEALTGTKLPSHYIDFLLQADGGDGFIGPDNHLVLWQLSELLELNTEYEASQYAPGFLLIGSDGGGEAIALDMRDENYSVNRIPFVGMEVDAAELIASNFKEFLIKLTTEDMYE